MKPKFKNTVPYYVMPEGIYLGEDEYNSVIIDNSDSKIEYLFSLINGGYTIEEIIIKCNEQYNEDMTQDIQEIFQTLSNQGYIENECFEDTVLTEYLKERYKANLNYYSLFLDMYGNKYELQKKINDTPITLLGVGGLGSQILYHLASLGFHNITILDYDHLELSNFNRQLLYSESDIGKLKTELAEERILQYNPNINLKVLNKKIGSVEDVEEAIQNSEYVLCVADKPTMFIQEWVNEAVVKLNIPLITGGILNKRGRFMTTLPDQGCLECHKLSLIENDANVQNQLEQLHKLDYQRNNAAISSNVAILAGILVNEFLDVVTGINNPISHNKIMEIDFTNYKVNELSEWSKMKKCKVCGYE
ncbi:HesA/MoeB/ThiF family protein [Macrococcus bovicus]|uniref:HesA/MoeB/ThiF family protein n=1 Tax=Macrococcus bovicus TaxID=69968 RepID=UPI0025A62A05|nr:ThiF family adenylyltransferase [Macrococcus bovicus]WJP96756.1 ThiF family adenylyltransferase [Macrococcus bovicus]